MPSARSSPGALDLTRAQILGYRRQVQALDRRLPPGPDSLRRAAWAGLQDSVPRSGLHALHARVEGVTPGAWADPSLAQVWGLRYTVHVVPAGDHAPFTLGRLPEKGRTRERAEAVANRYQEHLAGRQLRADEARRVIGLHPRYASLTGTILIRWNGARQPIMWNVPRPEMDPMQARIELVRRYLHFYGPSTAASFARWGGVDRRAAIGTFDALQPSLLAVRTPLGEGWILPDDEPAFRAAAGPPATARLLPSGDPFFLFWGADRELLVPHAARRAALWTSRVWPGALLVNGEIAGTWRRANALVVVAAWRRLTTDERGAVEAEVATLPLPGVILPAIVRWAGALPR